MPTTLLLVRHGENDWVKSNKLAGRTPGVHLNDKGRAQARRLSDRLLDWPIAAVYSSPLERCTETAQILAAPHHLDVEQNDGLLEADIGEWTGKKINDLKNTELWRIVQTAPSFATFPGGESMRVMQSRIVEAVHQIVTLHPDQIVLACSHSDMIKAALAHYIGAHLDHFQRIHVSPSALSIIYFTAHGPIVERLNDTGQLKPPPPPKKKSQDEPATHNQNSDAKA